MSRALGILVFCSLSLAAAANLSAAVITIPAIADADIHTETANIEDALDLVNVSLNRVGIFEFDLAAQIPAGSTILSATFRGFSEQVANNPIVDLIGYEATSPASIALADATAAGANLLTVNDPAGDTAFAFSLPAISSLQSALDGSGVFGLRAERTSSLGIWRIRSVELSRAVSSTGYRVCADPRAIDVRIGRIGHSRCPHPRPTQNCIKLDLIA